MDVEDLFHAARERTDPAARRAFLERACGDDAERRALVLALLDAEARAAGFLGAEAAAELAPGDRVDAYRLLERLGAGGGGEVFLARRDGTDLPPVALKVLRRRDRGRRFLEGFERERRALALMDHPTIARLIDAGATEDARPYLVMEHVDGLALSDYADRHRLPVRERLALLHAVALAVDHAHARGVVHRDLKPSNVLVAHVDGKPLPKVIDFGVAAAASLGADLPRSPSAFAGTPRYMAPEQAREGADGVDARADVFALGVLLLELLCGPAPLELPADDLEALRRAVAERRPVAPSRRLDEIGAAEAAARAAARACDPARLRAVCERELDRVVLRATDPDPARRHGSARVFAEDLERALRALDPLARLQDARLRAFEPAPLGATIRAEVLLAAAAGLERAGRPEGERAAALAQLEAGLAPVNFTTVARRVAAEAVFDPSARAIETDLEGEPLVQAMLLQSQGEAFVKLGLFERGLAPLERALELRRTALGDHAAETLETLKSLGVCLRNVGRLDEARPCYEACLAGWLDLAGEDDRRTIDARSNLGVLVLSEGDWRRAEALLRAAADHGRRALGVESESVARALCNLGAALEQLGRPADAVEAYRDGLGASRAAFGADDAQTLVVTGNLGRCLAEVGEHAAAERELRALVPRMRATLGDEHVNTLLTLHALARVLLGVGRGAEAVPLLEECAAGLEAQFEPRHEFVITGLGDLADALRTAGEVERAVAVATDARERAAALPADHPRQGALLLTHGRALAAVGRTDEGLALVRSACAALRAAVGADHAHVVDAEAVRAALEGAAAAAESTGP